MLQFYKISYESVNVVISLQRNTLKIGQILHYCIDNNLFQWKTYTMPKHYVCIYVITYMFVYVSINCFLLFLFGKEYSNFILEIAYKVMYEHHFNFPIVYNVYFYKCKRSFCTFIFLYMNSIFSDLIFFNYIKIS